MRYFTLCSMALGLTVSILTGCATPQLLGKPHVNSVDVRFVQVPDRSGSCSRVVDLRYNIINGDTPILIGPKGAVTQGDNVAALSISRDEIRQHYVPQNSAPTCYAASLTTAWKVGGLSADMSLFTRAAGTPCGLGSKAPATLLQILFAAYQVRTGETYNYLTMGASLQDALLGGRVRLSQFRQYRDGHIENAFAELNFTPLAGLAVSKLAGQKPSLPSMLAPNASQFGPAVPTIPQQELITAPYLYRSLDWHRTNDRSINGGIFPIGGTDDLVMHISKGAILIRGSEGRRLGHTVIITGIEYQPSGEVEFSPATRKYEYTLDEKTRITKVRILDPATPEDPERWVTMPMEQFFKETKFVFAVYPG